MLTRTPRPPIARAAAAIAVVAAIGLIPTSAARAGYDGIFSGAQNAGQPHTSPYVRPIYNVSGSVSSNGLPDLCVNAINYSDGNLAGTSACGKHPSHDYNRSQRRGYANSSQDTYGIAQQNW